MATSQVIAGPFTSMYNAINLNYTRRGFTLHFRSHGEQVNESDQYGRSLLDVVYQGGDVEIEAVCRVDSAIAKTAFWPWGAMGVISTTGAPIGRLGTNVALPFAMTAIPGTPAAVFAGPNTITASLAILSPDQDLQILYSSQARDVPIRFACLPAVGMSSDQNVAKVVFT